MATELLGGRYELGPRLGTGGMSTVVEAFDRRLERQVAIKLLAEHLADDAQFVARFRREALAAARLVHPNVVQVFDFGLDQQSNRHYIVMEVVHGQSGAEILRDHGRLTVQETLSIVSQACRGLEYAHRHGVIHRDVKPGNLLESEEGVVKLADFGIAKAISEESSITQIGSVLGTAAYLAPEQAAGERAGPQADLYGLGVVTYQFLAGRLPYEAQSLTELALKQQREIPPRLDQLNPEVTPQLAVAVERALALELDQRWPSADAMRRGLVDGARGSGPTTGQTRVAEAATSATNVDPRRRPAGSPTPVQQRQPRAPRPAPPLPTPAPSAPVARARPRRVRRTLRFVALLVVLAAGAAAAVIATSTSDNAVRLREVVYRDVNQAIDELKGLIDDNTR